MSTPPSTTAFLRVGKPSASKGEAFGRSARCGSSMMVTISLIMRSLTLPFKSDIPFCAASAEKDEANVDKKVSATSLRSTTG